MIQIAQWGSSIGLQSAMQELLADDFDPETADIRDDAVSTILMFGESIGTLTKHDLLSIELVNDWIWIGGLWARVGPAALKVREKLGEPRLYENFEALVKAA
jgi:hypothetical protein